MRRFHVLWWRNHAVMMRGIIVHNNEVWRFLPNGMGTHGANHDEYQNELSCHRARGRALGSSRQRLF